MQKIPFRKISLSLYIISLFTPMFFGDETTGYAGLLLGWLAFLADYDVFFGLAWLANIFYLVNALFRPFRRYVAIMVSLLTIALGCFALGIDEMLMHEGGLTNPVTVGIGFWICMLSFLILLVGQIFDRRSWENGNRSGKFKSMKLFPTKKFSAELTDDYSEAWERLKSDTDITDFLVSEYTKKEFRGMVDKEGFKLISSGLGWGAFCVLEGKFDGSDGIIETRIHKVFKVLLSLLLSMMLLFLLGARLFMEYVEYSILHDLQLVIIYVLFVRFAMTWLPFHIISRIGMRKLTKVLSIKELSEIK